MTNPINKNGQKIAKPLANIISAITNKTEQIINNTKHKKWESKDLRSVHLFRNKICTTNNNDFIINKGNNVSKLIFKWFKKIF